MSRVLTTYCVVICGLFCVYSLFRYMLFTGPSSWSVSNYRDDFWWCVSDVRQREIGRDFSILNFTFELLFFVPSTLLVLSSPRSLF